MSVELELFYQIKISGQLKPLKVDLEHITEMLSNEAPSNGEDFRFGFDERSPETTQHRQTRIIVHRVTHMKLKYIF